jgi:hypothetical protein
MKKVLLSDIFHREINSLVKLKPYIMYLHNMSEATVDLEIKSLLMLEEIREMIA